MRKIFVVEHSAWRQMKENYQIHLPCQFHLRGQLVDRDPQLSYKKMKTMFLLNMSKSWRLTSTFFPDKHAFFPAVGWFQACEGWYQASLGLHWSQAWGGVTDVRTYGYSKMLKKRQNILFCPRRNIIPTRTIIPGGWVSSLLLSSSLLSSTLLKMG